MFEAESGIFTNPNKARWHDIYELVQLDAEKYGFTSTEITQAIAWRCVPMLLKLIGEEGVERVYGRLIDITSDMKNNAFSNDKKECIAQIEEALNYRASHSDLVREIQEISGISDSEEQNQSVRKGRESKEGEELESQAPLPVTITEKSTPQENEPIPPALQDHKLASAAEDTETQPESICPAEIEALRIDWELPERYTHDQLDTRFIARAEHCKTERLKEKNEKEYVLLEDYAQDA